MNTKFDELLEFPCKFPFKVLGVARGVSPPFLGFQSARPLALEPDPSD